MLSRIDDVGEMVRGSPIKCLISVLNLAIFCNGIRDNDTSTMQKVLKQQFQATIG